MASLIPNVVLVCVEVPWRPQQLQPTPVEGIGYGCTYVGTGAVYTSVPGHVPHLVHGICHGNGNITSG